MAAFAEARRGRQIVLIGHSGHPEVIGTLGQVPDKFHLVSSVEDVQNLSVDDPEHLSYVTQTTLSIDECKDIVEALHRRFPKIKGPRQEDICYATQNRQNAVKELAQTVDLFLVLGAPNSSNSNRLKELSEQRGVRAHLIESFRDIQPDWLEGVRTVGITAGASAPEVLVGEVIDYLKSRGADTVDEWTVVEENVQFQLPKELVQIRNR